MINIIYLEDKKEYRDRRRIKQTVSDSAMVQGAIKQMTCGEDGQRTEGLSCWVI
jgi:hypothetical protein